MVIATRTERVMARRQVHAMIKADPVTISIERTSRVPDGAGGWRETVSTPPTSPIEVLLTTAKRRWSQATVSTEMGDVTLYPYLILARDGADIQRGDQFTWRGDRYEVKTVHPDPGISVTAQVDYFGGATNG